MSIDPQRRPAAGRREEGELHRALWPAGRRRAAGTSSPAPTRRSSAWRPRSASATLRRDHASSMRTARPSTSRHPRASSRATSSASISRRAICGLALMEASERTGSARSVDQVLLLCYHYDPATGKYGAVDLRAVRIGGVVDGPRVLAFLFVSLRRRAARTAAGPRTESRRCSTNFPFFPEQASEQAAQVDALYFFSSRCRRSSRC